MASNRGKAWELQFKQDWEKTYGKHTIDRIYDTVSGYRSISNISDFIGYVKPCIYYLECKSCLGASFPFANLTQHEKLKVKVGMPGVRAGVVLWLIDKQRVIYLPIGTVTKMKEAEFKSFNPEKVDPSVYKFVDIPCIKKRVFLEGDYSVLSTLEDGD